MSENKYIPGHGPIGAKLMLLGECPTSSDLSTGKPFSGSEARELDYLLKDAGINKSNCWQSTVSKYHVPPNVHKKKIPFHIRAKNAGIDIQQQLEELQNEINAIQPNCILALGGTPLWALSGIMPRGTRKKKKDREAEEGQIVKYGGITDYRGSIMMGMGRKFVATYNPWHLSYQATDVEFTGYWNRQIILFDFKRALKQSEFPDLVLPSRAIEICRSSAHLAEFRDRYKNKLKMSVDIEAGGYCIPTCIGLAFNKHHAMVIPLWNCDGITTIPDSDMIQIWIILAEMLYEKEIVGQNFNYDRDKIKRLGFIIRKLVSDTMLKAHAINPELPKGLAFNTSIFTEEPFYKNEGMYQGSTKDLYMGCGRDACVTYEVDEEMEFYLDELGQKKFFENFLMKFPDLYWGIEQQGMKTDVNERDRLIRKYVEWDERIRYELYCLLGTEINVNSHKQIGILLWDNLGLPRKDTTGEEDITALLNSPTAIKKPEHRKICELILEGRRVRKTISTNLMALPDFDGRMRTTYFPCLETGRTSTGQQDEPIRPTIEIVDEYGKKKKKALGTAFQVMTKHGDIGADIRGMYVPDAYHVEYDLSTNEWILIEEEEEFIQADSSQAEARVVALLSDDEQTLRMYDEYDIHALTASWFFGGSESDYSKKTLGYEHPIRFAGKTLRHAGHLGATKRRAAIELNTQARKYKIPIAITEQIAERALKIFHAKSPRIQQIFQAGIINCLQRTRQLTAPLPYGIDAECGGKRTFYERMGDELYRQGFSYIPQRAISDNTKAGAIRIKEQTVKVVKNNRIAFIKIVMESHDALLFSMPVSWKPLWVPIIKQEMERPIDFSRCSLPRHELSIPCEIESGKNYKDLKKFKDIPIIAQPVELPKMVKKSVTEEFTVVDLPKDSPLTDIIYHHQVERKLDI